MEIIIKQHYRCCVNELHHFCTAVTVSVQARDSLHDLPHERNATANWCHAVDRTWSTTWRPSLKQLRRMQVLPRNT